MSRARTVIASIGSLTILLISAWTWANRWYVANTYRLMTEGWITVVDRPLDAPNPSEIYRPLERVAGAAVATSLPRKTLSDVDFLAVDTLARETQSYSVLVWWNGVVVHEYAAPGIDSATRADGASMHKTVAALAVGAAIGRGLIANVDETVETYISEWRGQPRGQITVRDLLQMSSGLETFSNSGGPLSAANRFLAGLNPTDLVLSRPLGSAPGEEFAYRNLNTFLLGMIIARATGRRYAEFLSEAIWRPLGAADAQVWLDRADGAPRTYTALLARAEDWLRIGILIKDRGLFGQTQVIPKAYMDQMLAPAPTYANYGFQIWLARPYLERRYYNPIRKGLSITASAPIGSDDMVFLDGVGGQRVYISRDLDLVIVRLGVARPDWDDAALPNAVISALKPG